MGIHSKSEEHVHEEVSIKNQNEDKKKINARDVILNLDNHLGKQQKELTNVENVDALYMEDITIVYHVLRKRVLLINQIIKMMKQ